MFNTSVLIITALIAAAVVFAAPAISRRGPTEGTPYQFEDLDSIGDVLKRAKGNGKTVHIVYVHGMRADSSGASKEFIRALTESPYLQGIAPVAGAREPQWTKDDPEKRRIYYAGEPLVGDPTEWKKAWVRSSPFIIRTTFEDKANSFRVIVEELNWWPLLMGLRCRALVGPDSGLSGPAKKFIKTCKRNDDIADGDPYYPWLRDSDIGTPPIGRSATANRYVKHNIINWGFADAVIAVGPMRHYLRGAMDWAAGRATKQAADERIFIAESLGSFVAMDAARDEGPTRALVRKTHHFYFLANQFALLELARIEGIPDSPEGLGEKRLDQPEGGQKSALGSPLSVLELAGSDPKTQELMERPAQVVAVSDPSDVLTFLVPDLCPNTAVSNIQARFSGGPLLADPLRAHRGGIEGPFRIWKHLLKEHKGNRTDCPKTPG